MIRECVTWALDTFGAYIKLINLFHATLIICANSMDTDQARQNVGPDMCPNCLTLKFDGISGLILENS